MMRCIALAAVLLLLAGPAAAQDRLQPDERVRVVAPAAGFAQPIVGTVVGIYADTLRMRLGPRGDAGAVQVSVPVATITRLERSAGQGSRATHGLLGAVVGTGLGAVAGQLQYRMQSHHVDRLGEVSGRESLRTELTIAGAVIGTAVGVLLPGERWRRVPVLGSLASAGAGQPGAALGFTIAF